MKGRHIVLSTVVAIFFCIASLLADHAMAANVHAPNRAAAISSDFQVL